MNEDYQNFVTKILFEVDFVAPIKTLRVKSNTNYWFDIDVLNATGNRDKQYKKFKTSGKEIDKDSFNSANFLLKKLALTRKKFTMEKKLQKIRIILKSSGELFTYH